MTRNVALVGYRAGVAAAAATVAFDIVQILQVLGVLRFPADEILIYGTSLCIVVPFLLEVLAVHYVTPPDRQFWTHASLLFAVIYAVFVTANYVVQLATVIPARLAGSADAIQVLNCSSCGRPRRPRAMGQTSADRAHRGDAAHLRRLLLADLLECAADAGPALGVHRAAFHADAGTDAAAKRRDRPIGADVVTREQSRLPQVSGSATATLRERTAAAADGLNAHPVQAVDVAWRVDFRHARSTC